MFSIFLRITRERQWSSKKGINRFLNQLGLDSKKLRHQCIEAGLVGFISETILKPGQVFLSDRAGQFALFDHAGCWIHMERPLRKIIVTNEQSEKELKQVRKLQGDGQEDHCIIKREFSQDGRNLLLKEETEDGKVTTFEYLPKTDLLTLKIIKDGNRVLIRESFQYDDCNNLTQKCIDDGNAQKRITNYLLRQEQPFLHMPEWIEEKYLEQGVRTTLKSYPFKL